MNNANSIYAIVGPTASGKTGLGVALARRIGSAEIISCDSVQIYRDLQIATAKPSEEERGGVPHHLLDYVSPAVDYTAADWSRDAAEMIRRIEERGNTVVIVGGTGFYLRSLRRPLFNSPKTDPVLRKRLLRSLARHGPEHLHGMLRRLDPPAAGRLFPRDHVRTMRALEVFFQTGERISELQEKRPAPPEFAARIRVFALRPPRQELYDVINARAERHFEAGLVREVRELIERGVPEKGNALGSHGYRRVCEHLRGERTLENAVEKTKQDVRNYAKRQISWFRKEEGVVWLEGFGSDPEILDELWAYVSPAPGRAGTSSDRD